MILAIDVGNTNITCGIFDAEELVSIFRMPTDNNYDVVEKLYLETDSLEISGVIIGSVVDEINDRLLSAINKVFDIEPIVVSDKLKMSIKPAVESPKEVGADRVANAQRAWNIFKRASVTVDLGTATTFDIVNSEGEFIGGLIAPGIKTQLKSLSKATSKLPNLDLEQVEDIIGKNTKDAILTGVVIGTASMIDGMLSRAENKLMQKPVIILTGGFSEIISKHLTHNIDLISPNLTLEGLRDLYFLNKK